MSVVVLRVMICSSWHSSVKALPGKRMGVRDTATKGKIGCGRVW